MFARKPMRKAQRKWQKRQQQLKSQSSIIPSKPQFPFEEPYMAPAISSFLTPRELNIVCQTSQKLNHAFRMFWLRSARWNGFSMPSFFLSSMDRIHIRHIGINLVDLFCSQTLASLPNLYSVKVSIWPLNSPYSRFQCDRDFFPYDELTRLPSIVKEVEIDRNYDQNSMVGKWTDNLSLLLSYILPTQLQSLKVGRDCLSKPFQAEWVPETLEHLTLHGRWESLPVGLRTLCAHFPTPTLKNTLFPPLLEQITLINYSTSEPLNDACQAFASLQHLVYLKLTTRRTLFVLPPHLETFIINCTTIPFQEWVNVLPKGLKRFHFQSWTVFSLGTIAPYNLNTLPSGLQSLYLSGLSSYYQPNFSQLHHVTKLELHLDGSWEILPILPPNLKHLTLSSNFPIQVNQLPQQLETLECEYPFNGSIAKGVLPESLQQLEGLEDMSWFEILPYSIQVRRPWQNPALEQTKNK